MRLLYTVELEVEVRSHRQPPSPEELSGYLDEMLVESDPIGPWWVADAATSRTVEFCEEE